MNAYRTAQRAVADLQAAVLTLLEEEDRPLRNADIGRRLGIYFGHIGHEGHVSRAVLALLEDQGLVAQAEDRTWTTVDVVGG